MIDSIKPINEVEYKIFTKEGKELNTSICSNTHVLISNIITNEEDMNFEFEEIGNDFEISVFSKELNKYVTEKFSKNDIKFDTDIDWDDLIDDIELNDII